MTPETTRRLSLIAALAILAAPAAFAGTCGKIEYADAKDWPVEKAEKRYCMVGKLTGVQQDLIRDLRKSGLLSPKDSREMTADIIECLEQKAMFGRVIENV